MRLVRIIAIVFFEFVFLTSFLWAQTEKTSSPNRSIQMRTHSLGKDSIKSKTVTPTRVSLPLPAKDWQPVVPATKPSTTENTLSHKNIAPPPPSKEFIPTPIDPALNLTPEQIELIEQYHLLYQEPCFKCLDDKLAHYDSSPERNTYPFDKFIELVRLERTQLTELYTLDQSILHESDPGKRATLLQERTTLLSRQNSEAHQLKATGK